ncbi:DUF4252 domain-containing protein [Gramella sp. AN32]|nr:DUF4252 domain-containing protein [Gramella sp. AN32]
MTNLKTIVVIITALMLFSCNDNKSLQKYYVENQEDSDFLALDVPTSMFTNAESLDAEQKETLESIKKINVLAMKAEDNPARFAEEKEKLNEIFTDEKYQLLMKYGGGDKKAALYFTGDDDAIEELIVYGYDNEKGLGIARILGDDMNPAKIAKMLKNLDGKNINVSGLKDIAGIFGKNVKIDSSTTSHEFMKDSIQEVDNFEVD